MTELNEKASNGEKISTAPREREENKSKEEIVRRRKIFQPQAKTKNVISKFIKVLLTSLKRKKD